MIETVAITLATIMIPTASLNATLPENYSVYAEPTVYVQQANEPIGTGTVLTPNGTAVDVGYYKELVNEFNIDDLTYQFVGSGEDYSGLYMNLDKQIVTLMDKNIKPVGIPTTTYDAEAFAFYMYWEDVDYSRSACIMGEQYEKYLEDYSYVEVSEPQENDIVCYLWDKEVINAGVVTSVNEKEASDPADGSAMVKKLSKCNVISMWWIYGLYSHRGDLCPYISQYATRLVTENETTSVKYYRRHNKQHNYTYTDKTSTHHTANCFCGIKRTEEHTWTPVSNIGATRPGMVVRCISCSFLKRLNPDEFVPVIRPLKMPFDIKSLIK